MTQTHLSEFWNCFPTPPHQGAVGGIPKEYLEKLNTICNLKYSWPKGHPDGQLTRDQLRKLCSDHKVNVLIAYAAVMAWGGRGVDSWNYKLSLSPESRKCLSDILIAIRNGNGNRRDDFEKMQKAAMNIKGLGISFYTKLLFFFRKDADAYILDQFTTKSANLLFDSCQVALNSSGYPNPGNTPDNYAWFCSSIEELGRRRNLPPPWSGEQVEQAMFDVRGGKWRKHLRGVYGLTGLGKYRILKRSALLTDSLPARVTRIHTTYYRAGCEIPGASPKGSMDKPVRLHCLRINGVDWQYAFFQKHIDAQVFIPSMHIARYDSLRCFLGVTDHDFGNQIFGNGGKGGKTRSLRLRVPRGLGAPQNEWDEIARQAVRAMHTLYNRVCENL